MELNIQISDDEAFRVYRSMSIIYNWSVEDVRSYFHSNSYPTDGVRHSPLHPPHMPHTPPHTRHATPHRHCRSRRRSTRHTLRTALVVELEDTSA